MDTLLEIENENRIVMLITSDDVEYNFSIAAIQCSEVLKTAFEGDKTAYQLKIDIPNEIFIYIAEYMNHHATHPIIRIPDGPITDYRNISELAKCKTPDDRECLFDTTFINNLPKKINYEIMKYSDQYQIDGILRLAILRVAFEIRGMQIEEIEKYFQF